MANRLMENEGQSTIPRISSNDSEFDYELRTTSYAERTY